MYAPPGADAPRAAAAETALTKARRKDAAEQRKNWLAKNAASLPHRRIPFLLCDAVYCPAHATANTPDEGWQFMCPAILPQCLCGRIFPRVSE